MTEPLKAIISNRIYLKPRDQSHREQILKELTYVIEHNVGSGVRGAKSKRLEIIKNYKVLPGGVLSIPQGRMDLVGTEYEIVDKRVMNSVPFPLPKHSLRDSQLEVYNQVNDTCFINALVGWGKTFTALHIARKLEQKTLVLTHNTFLRDQWVKEVKSLFGLNPGIIGSGEFDIEDHFIVIANIQTAIKIAPKISKEFGTVILDEAHHVPADTFHTFIDSMYSRYRIALSGTMERKDQKHLMFKDFFGETVYRTQQSNTLNPFVKILNTVIFLNPRLTWVQKVNELLYNEDYQDFVAGVAATQIKQNHSVLLIADRVEFLENVKEKIGEDCALVTGKTSFEEREQIAKKVNSGEVLCIAGSRQIFSEGISINRLSCVILPTPSANLVNLEQIIGRIMRMYPNKPDPVVIDLHFSSAPEKKQQATKLGFYMGKGWQIDKL
jgi:superfamily II DNA or RNA helicase